MKKYNSIFVFLLCALIGHAQEVDTTYQEEIYEDTTPYWSGLFNMNCDVTIPRDAFNERFGELGNGASFNFYVNRSNFPVYLGWHFGLARYDSERFNYTQIFEGEVIPFREVASTNSFATGPIVRFEPNIDFFFRPYVEGTAGLSLFYARTKVVDEELDEVVDSFGEGSDVAWHYGGTAGVEISLYDNYTLSLDLRCSYLFGTEAEYFVKRDNPGQLAFPIDAFELTNSTTNRIIPQIGVTFYIADGVTYD